MIRAETQRLLTELATLLGEKVELSFEYQIDPDLVRLRAGMSENARLQSAALLIDQLVAQEDPDLASEIHHRLVGGQFRYNARLIIQLLDELKGPDVEKALRLCLSLTDLDAVAAALRALRHCLRASDVPMLLSLLRSPDHAVGEAAIVAAGNLRDPALADAVADRLNSTSADERMHAAITLGLLGETRFASHLLARLGSESGRTFGAFVAALEMLGNREAVPGLVELLRTAPDEKVWDLSHALRLITGVDPVAEDTGGREGFLSELRTAWLRADTAGHLFSPPTPAINSARVLDRDLATFDLAFGRGVIRIDFDPPSLGSTWPRWDRSLFVAGKRLYGVGSTCGTCEFFLKLVEWPSETLSATARGLEEFDAAGSLTEWISVWSPLFKQLRSGHYLVGRLSVPLERIGEKNAALSWFNRRREIRVLADPGKEDLRTDSEAPRTVHYQGPRTGEVPMYPVVMPTHDPSKLDEACITEYQRAISHGARPAVVTYAWLDEREVQGEWSERFLNLMILNGHHRIEAYVRAGVLAPIVAVARIADSWGPPNYPDRLLREALDALAPR